jgi:hypothetical protein
MHQRSTKNQERKLGGMKNEERGRERREQGGIEQEADEAVLVEGIEIGTWVTEGKGKLWTNKL